MTPDVWELRERVMKAIDGSQLSRDRRGRILDALDDFSRDYRRESRYAQEAFRREVQEAHDLRVHLRDRDAHIANLEAQLRPLITDAGHQTEALL
jgi:hypothetical protein